MRKLIILEVVKHFQLGKAEKLLGFWFVMSKAIAKWMFMRIFGATIKPDMEIN